MGIRSRLKLIPLLAALSAMIACAVRPAAVARAAAPGTSATPALPDTASDAPESNAMKAHQLVTAAINMTDSQKAVQLLWQATELDPTLDEPYMYLALYYDSRSQFNKVVQVYRQLLKYQPKEITAYINIGEAYMSFMPARTDLALPYYRKALQLDSNNSFAALRIGEIYAQQGNREQAVRYLRLASGDHNKNPTVAAEADKVLRQMGAS